MHLPRLLCTPLKIGWTRRPARYSFLGNLQLCLPFDHFLEHINLLAKKKKKLLNEDLCKLIFTYISDICMNVKQFQIKADRRIGGGETVCHSLNSHSLIWGTLYWRVINRYILKEMARETNRRDNTFIRWFNLKFFRW